MASHRRTVAAACAVILASISLYPIFTGTAWFWAGCGSALVVGLAGTATRLRRLPVPVTLLAGVLALLLYLNLTFANARSLYHLLPTPGVARGAVPHRRPGVQRGVQVRAPGAWSCAAWCCSRPAASASPPCSPT